MALSLLTENYQISIIGTHEQVLQTKMFKDVQFHQIQLIKTGPLRYLEFHKKTKTILQNNKYDVIMSCDLYSLSAVVACRKLTKQIIYDCREIYFELAAHTKKPIHRYWNYFFEKYYLKHVNQIMVTADTDLKYLQNIYRKHALLQWHVIYNYPYKTFVKKLPKLLPPSIPKNNIKIIYQGVLQKGRGIARLIDLANHNDSISVVVVGDGEHRNYFLNYNQKYNVNKNVYFVGKIPYLELLNITSQCDIGWALITKKGLSNQFALPNKLFEYLVSGIPVLASDLPNIRNIFNKYGVGEIVQSNTIEGCNKMIIKIYENKNEYTKNIFVAAKNFTWDIQHAKFMEVVSGK
jgi:glycosyltransferase involved in cell wall biosynthesis